jgi:hypothetical protein
LESLNQSRQRRHEIFFFGSFQPEGEKKIYDDW